jgi:hypothetical protein
MIMKKNTENKSLRAVVYVKESGSASSFPMAVELLPIASEPDDKITYLEWTHIPGEEDNAFRNTDRFKCCFQVMSIFALVFNFLMTTTAFIFFMLILSSSLRQDKCDTVFGWLMTLIALGLFAWNIWMKLSTLISYDSSVNVWYKIIDGISILYHLANNVEHAVARLRLAVRQRAIRRATRAAADGERLRRFHQDESATALDAATVATEHDPAWLAPLRTALGALDDVVRTALVRHHLYDESYDELAQLFQLPAATLRQRCHRARRQLADALQPYADAA